MHLRTELSRQERLVEPKNADAHLTFIGSGLVNCVTYENRPGVPVHFIDLDGVNGSRFRTRRTTLVGFDREIPVGESALIIPVSQHPIDSVNLQDRRLGLFDEFHHQLKRHGMARGRIELSLEDTERGAGLTVNEYETLLMKRDLADVLRNPFRFMAERGKHMLLNPRAIPSKAKGYARYDLVQVINEFLDTMGLSESMLERIIQRFMAVPASRRLRMKRSVSLLVLGPAEGGVGKIVEGKYQRPILIQWKKAMNQQRHVRASFVGLE
jgi:hypothetical protein